MPINPDGYQLRVSRPLTNISVAWMQDQPGIATQVFPVVPSTRQGDMYYKYDRGSWFSGQAELRAPATESAGGGWSVSTDSFFAFVYAIHQDLDDQTLANADEMFNVEADAARWVASQLQLKQEKDFLSLIFTTSTWTGTYGGSADSDQQGSWGTSTTDLVEIIRGAAFEMLKKTGYRANTLVLDVPTAEKFLSNDELLDRIKHTQTGIVTLQLAAEACGLDRILVSETVQQPSTGGDTLEFAAQAASGSVKGRAWLGYVPPRAGLRTPSAGYTFSWTGLLGAGALGVRTKRFRIEELEAVRIEAEMAYDQKIVAAELGHLFVDTITT